MWCWRRLEKISWTDHVRNEQALYRVKWERNILHWSRNCLLKPVIKGKIGRDMSGGRMRKNI